MKRFIQYLMMCVLVCMCCIPVHGESGLEFTQELLVKEGVYVPSVTFTYRVSPNTAITSFAHGDREYPVEAGVNGGVHVDPVVIDHRVTSSRNEDGYLCYDKKGSLDVNLASFNHPGIYVYDLEVESSARKGLTNEASGKKYKLYLFIENKGNGLGLQGVNLYDEKEKSKVSMFKAKFDTNALRVKKVVSGNQGDRTRDFGFSVLIQNDAHQDESTYQVFKKSQGGKSEVKLDSVVKKGQKFVFTLKDDEYVRIVGLSQDDHVEVVEEDANQNGYVTSYEKQGLDDAGKVTSEEAVVTVTNSKEALVPTGVNDAVMPYVVVMGAVGVVAYMKFRAA